MIQQLLDAIRRWRRKRAKYVLDTVEVSETEIDAAIRVGCQKSGVSTEHYAPDQELGRKFHEVLFHAGKALGYQTSTIQDVAEWLR